MALQDKLPFGWKLWYCLSFGHLRKKTFPPEARKTAVLNIGYVYILYSLYFTLTNLGKTLVISMHRF
jgi:hypothetical protein